MLGDLVLRNLTITPPAKKHRTSEFKVITKCRDSLDANHCAGQEKGRTNWDKNKLPKAIRETPNNTPPSLWLSYDALQETEGQKLLSLVQNKKGRLSRKT